MPNILFDPTIEGLARTLTLHQQRHAVLASNLSLFDQSVCPKTKHNCTATFRLASLLFWRSKQLPEALVTQ